MRQQTQAFAPWPWSFLHIAHRGIPSQAPENSLRGFALAMDLGADMVETDLRRSADGVVILAHDAALRRPGEQPLPVAAASLSALRRYAGGGSPATLDEALGLRHHGAPLAFNLDLKAPAMAEALVQAFRRAGRREGILLTGAAAATFAAVRGQESWVAAALTREARWRNAPRRALARVLPALGGAVLGAQLVAAARAGGVNALTVEQTLASPASVAACHRAGLRIVVWTVDEPQRMAALRAAGVDGITTNRVDLLVALDAD